MSDVTAESDRRARYRFDRSAAGTFDLLNFAAWQWVVGGGTIVVAGFAIRLIGLLPAAVLALVGVASCGMRRNGDLLLPQIPAAVSYRLRRRHDWVAPMALMYESDGVPVADLPPALAGLVILGVEGGDHGLRPGPVAIVHDVDSGLYSATLRVSGKYFALVDWQRQEHQLYVFGQAMSEFCQDDNEGLVQIRWSEWAAPAGINSSLAYLNAHRHREPVPAADATVRAALAEAGPASVRHETLVTLVQSPHGLPVSARRRRDIEAACIGALLAKIRSFASALDMHLHVTGPLTPMEMARAIRVRLDPSCAPELDVVERNRPGPPGVPVVEAGVMAVHAGWDEARFDGSWRRTFRVAEWPRLDVRADFLNKLIMLGRAVRSLAVCYVPVSPHDSDRAVQKDASRLAADTQHKEKHGWLARARDRKAKDAVEARDEELAAGFAEHRFVGFVDVCAPDLDGLDEACVRIRQTAAQCGLQLRSLHGQHDRAVLTCLPIPRGVKTPWLT